MQRFERGYHLNLSLRAARARACIYTGNRFEKNGIAIKELTYGHCIKNCASSRIQKWSFLKLQEIRHSNWLS